MDALPVILPAESTAITLREADLDAARGFLSQEKAASTRRTYAAVFRGFEAYCLERGLQSLPAAVETVMSFLAAEARAGRSAGTIGHRAAAIRHAHKLAGYEPPTSSEAVRATVRGIRRSLGAAPVRKAPAVAAIVRTMLDGCPDTLRGKRDRALLALGFAGAFRRSELVALRVEDLAWVADGLRVTIRRSKTDQEGVGQVIAIPRGSRLRPVEAVEAWVAAAGIAEGPLLRSVAKGGRIGASLTPEVVSLVVKAHCVRTGLDPAVFSAHSLRAGFITSSAEAGATVWKMREVSRHKSIDVLSGYVRSVNLFQDHAGSSFL